MGEYAHLNLATCSSPSVDTADYLSGEGQILFKWNAAIAWLALFRQEDFVEQPCFPFGEDSESFQGLYLFAKLSDAINCFEKREPTLSRIFGSTWSDNVAEFRRYLGNPAATHIELDLCELLDDDRTAKDTREYYEGILRAFDEPMFSGKKGLLSRQPKLSRGWSSIKKEAESLARGKMEPSVLFGAREDWSWWTD